MFTEFEPHTPRVGLGMTSLGLGFIALLLAFLPILALPIASFGLLLGLAGFLTALFRGGLTFRWALAGIVMSSLALGANFALYSAPTGYLPPREVPKLWRPPEDRPYVPPPAN